MDIGRLKTQSASDAIRAINPHVAIEAHPVRLGVDNALDLIARYDIIADGSDNFATRFLVADACFFAKKSLVSAAVSEFSGQLSTFKPFVERPALLSLPVRRTATSGNRPLVFGNGRVRCGRRRDGDTPGA